MTYYIYEASNIATASVIITLSNNKCHLLATPPPPPVGTAGGQVAIVTALQM